MGIPGDLPVLVPGGPGGHQAPDGGQPGRRHRGGGAGHRVLEVDRGWAGARGGDCRGVGGLRRQAARVSVRGDAVLYVIRTLQGLSYESYDT